MLTIQDFKNSKSNEEFIKVLREKENPEKVNEILHTLQYEKELLNLQAELVNLQQWVAKHKKRVCIIFEGRDAAGKGSTIRRFIEHLNPRSIRVAALTKPTETESGQWYFRRYIKVLPNPGEIVFFDRSWYNRAVSNPLWDFATNCSTISLWFRFQNLNICYTKTGLML